MKVDNPVLRGFTADPSFLRVGEDYYIAASTFEWFPGVPIYHSKDLVNWELIDYALKDDEKVNLEGVESACGIWAPNLTYSNGKFYLMYTIVYTNRSRYKDTWNYLITADNIHGPWSEPVAINRSGFDPSLFHDTDGKKYIVNMVMDHRPDTERFAGVEVQEYDEENKKLIGNPVRVFNGSVKGFTEGPNILKKDNTYYLFCAAGGTAFGHCEIVVKSESLFGPYIETDRSVFLTSVGYDCKLKRAGHAQVVEATDGSWYMAHLCGRPIDGEYSVLGRETAIQNVEWTEDGWIKISGREDNAPNDYYTVAGVTEEKKNNTEIIDFSKGDKLSLEYMTLRRGFGNNGVSVTGNLLHLEGGCSLLSMFHQSMVARRLRSLNADYYVCMKADPKSLNHMSGIIAYYNYDNFIYLRLLKDENGKCLSIVENDNRELSESEYVRCQEDEEYVTLKISIRNDKIDFYYEFGEQDYNDIKNIAWKKIGLTYDSRHLSDEYIEGNGFTGCTLGVSCNNLQGDEFSAEFKWLMYEEC